MPELDSPPSLATLYPRALAGAVLALPRKLPGLGGGGRAKLPDLELVVRDVEVDREHLASYDRVCGFRLRDELPPTYPHMVAFPLAMRLMTDGSFPFPVMGLVHIANRIEQQRPLRSDERLDFTVRAADLREHERGTAFDVVADVTADGEPVWHSASTYLRRGGGSGSSGTGSGTRATPPSPDAIWSVPGDIGRRYGAVSGDINPIHMHPLSARLFGFPKPIAHGMWLKARCLAALEGQLPDGPVAVEVAFKLPLPLPAKAAFASRATDVGGRDFSVHGARDGKPHLTGSVRPA